MRPCRDSWRKGRARSEKEEGGAREERKGGFFSPGSDPQKKKREGLESSRGKALPPSRFTPSPPHTHWARVRCGYVAGLSGLLTGLPPFITAGSVVLLLGGTAALATVSPTSCNDGSLYMATVGAGDKERKQRDKRKDVSKNLFSALFEFTCLKLFKGIVHPQMTICISVSHPVLP